MTDNDKQDNLVSKRCFVHRGASSCRYLVKLAQQFNMEVIRTCGLDSSDMACKKERMSATGDWCHNWFERIKLIDEDQQHNQH